MGGACHLPMIWSVVGGVVLAIQSKSPQGEEILTSGTTTGRETWIVSIINI